jgi:hypothetical protein
MTSRNDHSIILVGYWNRLIFTPEWVGRKLFGGVEQVQVEIPILPVDPIVYTNDMIELKVGGGRLVFRALTSNMVNLKAIETAAMITLQELNDTPILGVGINFAFQEKRPPKELKTCFEFPDEATSRKAGWKSPIRRAVRHHEKGGKKLTFVATESPDGIHLDLNYHQESEKTVGTDTVLKCLNEGIETYWDTSLDFLKRVYKVQLEEAASNGRN